MTIEEFNIFVTEKLGIELVELDRYSGGFLIFDYTYYIFVEDKPKDWLFQIWQWKPDCAEDSDKPRIMFHKDYKIYFNTLDNILNIVIELLYDNKGI